MDEMRYCVVKVIDADGMVGDVVYHVPVGFDLVQAWRYVRWYRENMSGIYVAAQFPCAYEPPKRRRPPEKQRA